MTQQHKQAYKTLLAIASDIDAAIDTLEREDWLDLDIDAVCQYLSDIRAYIEEEDAQSQIQEKEPELPFDIQKILQTAAESKQEPVSTTYVTANFKITPERHAKLKRYAVLHGITSVALLNAMIDALPDE